MDINVIALRPANGTTPRDLEDVRSVLRPADGWTVEQIDDDAPWIAATGPGGTEWAIGRQGGSFFASSDPNGRAGWSGLRTASDAARIVAQVGRAA